MSYLEFFGTVLNIVCVWLTVRKSVWNWPIGIIAVSLFGALFYQIQLYSDFLEQVYYFGTGIWGWIIWTKLGRERAREHNGATDVAHATFKEVVWIGAALIIGTSLLGIFMSEIHNIFPASFPSPASFPYLDAFTTVASFVAQILLIFRRIENWYLWILVDVIGAWLYNEKEVKFVAILYFIFLILAITGLLSWIKELKRSKKSMPSLLETEGAREGVGAL